MLPRSSERCKLEQQVEFARNLQRLENALAETQGLVRSLAQMQIHLLERQNEKREEMDRRLAEMNERLDRRFAETDERIRRLAELIERGFHPGNGARP